MSWPKGMYNSGIKNIYGHQFKKGKSGYSFQERIVNCHQCANDFFTRAAFAKFCSVQCKEAGRPEKQKTEFICLFCETPFRRRCPTNAGKFCSRQCSGMFNIAHGKKNYFYKAFLYYPHQCNRCEISDYELLVVHHIDLNHDNNDISNTALLNIWRKYAFTKRKIG